MKRSRSEHGSEIGPHLSSDRNSVTVRGEPARVLLVVAPYYRDVAEQLRSGATTAIKAAGCHWEEAEVPGALEIPAAIRIAGSSDRFDGYVALGCVIRGETTHYRTVSDESARGIALLNLQGFCIGNGILTVETMDQARKRADPSRGDKGGEAARASLALIDLMRRFGGMGGPIGFRTDPIG